jgi:hypothetical protein
MEKERKEIGKRFRKLEKIVRKIGMGFCRILRSPGVGVIYGTAVMARRTGRRGPRCARDSRHGGRPRRWEGTRGAGPGAGGAGGIRGTRAGVRGRDSD